MDDILTNLHGRVGERVRAELVRNGASEALQDPSLFHDVDAILRAAIDRSKPAALLLPELLGDPAGWRLETALKYQSHRGGAAGAIIFVKRRVLMPILRWFHEFNRDNFERQRRVNLVLFACVQELAIESARLRRDIEAARGASAPPARTDAP